MAHHRQEVRVSKLPEGEKSFSTTYKILIIGDTNVGKTALLNRFCEGAFQTSLVSTVGIDHKNKVITLDDENVKLQIWDTAGQERFRTLTNAYFRGAAGALLLYDITQRATYVNVADWMDSVQTHGSEIQVVIVGHKSDLDDQRSVSPEEGRKLAENYDCKFFEASAKAGTNCCKVFTILAQQIKEMKENAAFFTASRERISTSLTESSQLALSQEKSSSGCC